MQKRLFLILILPVLALVGAWFLRGVFATSNPHQWTNGLVGYWSFDGQYTTSTAGTRDVSGNNNWGTFYNGVKPIAGISGQALSFDGVDDYVDAGNGTSLRVGGGSFTLEAWVKSNNVTQTQTIVENRSSLVVGYSILIASSKAYFELFGGGYNPYLNVGAVANNRWYHIVGVRDIVTDKIYLYLNGVEVGNTTDTTTGTLADIIETLIGYWGRSPNYFFNGLIDEVRIYSRALSADEVLQHYQQTKRNLVINQPSGAPPVGWWKLDENPAIHGSTIRDYSVNANTGTLTTNNGTTNKSTDGKIGKALSFDGVDDYVWIGDPASLQPSKLSISLWFKTTTVPSEIKVLIRKRTYGYIIGQEIDGKLSFSARESVSSSVGVSSLISYSDGIWHHFVGTYDGTTSKMYIDGGLVNSTTGAGTGTIYYGTGGIAIGRDGDWSGNYFNGLIDEVRIYNYARTADQIAADYRAGAYRTIVGTSVPSNWWTNGLVGYWNFDGPNTTTTSGASAGTRDVSGNNNWGTFYNGVKPTAGVVGQALSFDGVNDYVDAGNGASLNIAGALTVEAWVKFNNLDANFIVTKGVYPNYNYKLDTWNSNGMKIDFLVGINGAQRLAVDTDNYTTNVWYHTVGTYDGIAVRLYVNGILKATTYYTGTPAQSTNPVIFGKYVGGGYQFNGLIDEVRIYNRALSADEVKQHYQQTKRSLGI